MEYRSATTAARSEKDLIRAEKFGLDALETTECNPDTNALIPYFLAKEVYLKQKKYTEMAKMLNMAEQINPNQPLEEPYKLGEQSVETIGEGVDALREEVWGKLFNNAVALFNQKKYKKAEEQFKLCLTVHPNQIENYRALVDVYRQNGNNDLALKAVITGLNIDSQDSYLNMTKADFSIQNNDLDSARELYLRAIEFSDDPGPIKIKLLNTYIELGENKIAIDFSNELLNQYPNNPDIYYNVGVVYSRITKEKMDLYFKLFNEINQLEKPTEAMIRQAYDDIRRVRKYAYSAKEYFLEASDLEQSGDLSTEDAVKEMNKILNNIDNIYMDNVKTLARKSNIELD